MQFDKTCNGYEFIFNSMLKKKTKNKKILKPSTAVDKTNWYCVS